jgi:hypothetical protein
MVVVVVIMENSDNGMTQNTWAFCVASVRETVHRYSWTCDEWFTESSSARQSVCWALQVFTDKGADQKLREELALQGRSWRPQSLQWIQSPSVEKIVF